MRSRILMTGGAGFVGSHLCLELREKGYTVLAIDDLSNGSRENLPPDFPFLKMDISDPELNQQLSRYDFDAVIHCAAQSSNALSFRDPQADLKSNQLGTLNLLNFCKSRNIDRFLFTSSMSAYGQPMVLPTPETTPCHPDTFYGIHKMASEHSIRVFAQEYGLNYTILRLYTTYGRGQSLLNRDQGLLSIYLSYILAGEPLVVKGSKDRTRDIIHVTDVVAAIVKALEEPRTFWKIYNLGTGQRRTIEQIIELLLKEAGQEPGRYPIRYRDKTPGDPHDTLADIAAIQRDVDWHPMISPEQGICMTVRGLKK